MEIPPAADGHGWTLEDRVITLLPYEGDCFPTFMVDDILLEEEISDIMSRKKYNYLVL